MRKTVAGRSDRSPKRYRDTAGRSLADYPRPSVAVDAALLTLLPSAARAPELAVLQVKREDGPGWGLPGTFLHEGERLIDAVLRALRDKAGVIGLRPRQLRVFDDPERDDRGWVLSVAHVDVGPADRLDERTPQVTRLMPVAAPGRLPYGHGDIIALATADLQQRYLTAPDPDHLLPDAFTLRDLRIAHEAVAGHALQRDTFRRAMDPLMAATGEMSSGTRGRPAELFTRATA